MITVLNLIRKYWIYITLLIFTVITILSLVPPPELPPMPGSDKTHHLIAYSILIFPAALRKPDYLPAICLFFTCGSGAIELIQPLVNRYGEFSDLLANITGLVCGLLAAKFITWLLPANSECK